MRCLLFVICWFLTSEISVSFAQNLVPNPGFEQLKLPPCKLIADGNVNNINQFVVAWVAPTGGTSDILVNKAIADSCRTGLDKRGYTAHSGEVCAGFYTVGSVPPAEASGIASVYREYIQCRLIQNLIPNKIYKVELYIRAYKSNTESIISCYTNNIGCYFSADSIFKQLDRFGSLAPFGVLRYDPQINEFGVVDDPTQWHKITGCFRATAAARYLTIGNFYNSDQTKYTTFSLTKGGAYYFIDDISVTETQLSALPTLSLPDTILCLNRPLTFTLNPQQTYQWQDGSSNPTYTITRPGLYSVTATAEGCVVSDTFSVREIPRLLLPSDTTICRGTSFILAPVQPVDVPIRWNNASTTASLTVVNAGTYTVQTESASCPQTASVRIGVGDCPGLVPNVFTPNDDGRNDAFVIDGITLAPWRLVVYDRWGRRVFDKTPYRNDWAGESLPTGVYYYLLTSSVLQKEYKGWVQLLR